MKDKILSIFKSSKNKKLDPIDIISHIKKNYTSEDIKKVLEKYICITNNNYESGKCK